MQVGYARESSVDQNIASQLEELRACGCEEIFQDTICSAKAEHNVLSQALDYLSEGDILVIRRLDILGLNLKKLIRLMKLLQERQIGFRSLVEAIDTEAATGRAFFQVTGALDEMERNLRREQARAGLNAARAQGRTGGRPKSIDPETFAIALDLYGREKETVESICNRLGIARRTFYRYRAKYNAEGQL